MNNVEHEVMLLRSRIVQLEGQVEFLYKHLGVTFVPESAPGDDPRIIDALKKGNLLEAIKVYREVHSTGTVVVGLNEAKRGVEDIQRRLGI